MKILFKPAKALLAFFAIVLVSACGGGSSPVSLPTVPTPSRLASPVAGDTEIALHVYQALYGKAPGFEQLNTLKGQITANGAAGWANSMAANFANLSNTEFAALVLKNISVAPSTLTATASFGTSQQAYDGLLAGFRDYLSLVGPANRGVVAAQLAKIISNLEVDTQFGVYGGAALALNRQIAANVAYSANAANVTDGVASVGSVSTYQAGLSIGDNGILTIDTTALKYSLTITNSSFGLEGKTLSGSITDNGDGSYRIAGTQYGTIVTYPNYAFLSVKLDPANPDLAGYFKTNPAITKVNYAPVLAMKKDSLLTTVDDITSNGRSMELRGVQFQTIPSQAQKYSSAALRGNITKVSNTSFDVEFCTNGGNSNNNSRLNSANCTGSIVTKANFQFDSAKGYWLSTIPVANFPNFFQVAYFVKDVMADSVVGYMDASDKTGAISRMRIVTVVPAATPFSLLGAQGTLTYTNFQLCSSDANCASTNGENGIFFGNAIPKALFPAGTSTRADGGCTVTDTVDVFSPGFSTITYSAGSTSCSSPGSRPDFATISFGTRVVNGQITTATASAGYDSTVSPSAKIAIGLLQSNTISATRTYTVFDKTAKTSTVSATVEGAGASETLAFAAPRFTLIGATTNTPTWSSNGGQVRANGNALVYCSVGQNTGSDSSNRTGARVLLSGAVAVTDLIELRGKSFAIFDCTKAPNTVRINADGSGTQIPQVGAQVQFPASVVAAAFSAAGFTGPDGAYDRFIPFKITTNGETRYFIVSATVQADKVEYAVLMSEI